MKLYQSYILSLEVLENYGGSCNGGKTGIFSLVERLPHPVEKPTPP